MTDKQLEKLLHVVVDELSPQSVYLFGSRARGDMHQASDYDLMVVLPDDAPLSALSPHAAALLGFKARVPADIMPVYERTFIKNRDRIGTLSYRVAREGQMVYDRA